MNREHPPRAPLSSTSGSEFLTTSNASSDLRTSDTEYGLSSLMSNFGDETIGCEMTAAEANWLKLAQEFTKAEKPFKEQKSFRVVRKLRIFHPKRGVSWSFLRRLYNGRQDMKEEEIAEKIQQEVLADLD